MSIENFELVGSYNNQRFPNIDAERTINMFEYVDLLGKKPKSLISTSGLQNTNITFQNSHPSDGFRMEYVLNGFEYLVIGQNFYRRDQFNNIVQLNDPLGSQPILGNGFVGVDANNASGGSQIMFVDGQLGHLYDTGTGKFTYNVRLVDTGFPSVPVDVTFLDGFLIVANGGTGQFQLSALNNAYSWSLVSSSTVAFDHTTNLITPNTGTIYTTGMPLFFDITGGGTMPTGLTANVQYFAISVSATQIRIADTLAHALSNTFLTFSTNGIPPIAIRNIGIVGTSTQAFAPGQLQLGSINSHPGNIVACRTLHRRLFLFSSNFTEIWENAGAGTNLPLRRNNALLMEYGTPSIGSIATGFDKMMFLSQDRDGLGAVMEVIGTESIPVSNRALDFQLAQYASIATNPPGLGIADARGIFIKENGIIFYRLNFTTANHTFVYNVTLSNPQTEEGKLWHEEQVLNGNRHPAQTHGYFNGVNYYGSYNAPVLYQVDQAFVTNDGEAIARIRTGRCHVPSAYNRTRIDRFMIDVIQGQLLSTNMTGILDLLAENGNIIDTESGLDILLESSSQAVIYDYSEPPLYLSFSKDGGVSYGNRLSATLGAIGDRTHRTVYRKLCVIPRGQGFVPKVEFFSAVPFIILGAAWAYEVMPE